jgi:hypothetical protein
MLFTWTIFFSSPELFQKMLQKEIYCCGTVRLNRRGMPEAIKAAKFKKRGEIITNCDPTQQRIVQRRQKDDTRQDVPAPVASELYNKFMFGVDLADQNRMQYSTRRKAKKMVQILVLVLFRFKCC